MRSFASLVRRRRRILIALTTVVALMANAAGWRQRGRQHFQCR